MEQWASAQRPFSALLLPLVSQERVPSEGLAAPLAPGLLHPVCRDLRLLGTG